MPGTCCTEQCVPPAAFVTVTELLWCWRPQIADENDNTVRRGQKGEIQVKGYSVMKGYWGDPAKTKEVGPSNTPARAVAPRTLSEAAVTGVAVRATVHRGWLDEDW